VGQLNLLREIHHAKTWAQLFSARPGQQPSK
jgi:hypothetical protein